MNRTLPQLVNEYVKNANPQVFFKSKQTIWSPEQFYDLVLTWAKFLKELGVQPGDRVGIYLNKSLEEVGFSLAISFVGAIFVNIHPSNKFLQLEHIIQDCDIHLLISSRDLLRTSGRFLQSLKLKNVIVIDNSDGLEPSDTLHELKEADSLPRLSSSSFPYLIDDDFATILYTSGSTGKPKGIIQTHGNLIEGAEIVSNYVRNTPEDRVLSLLPFSFDYGLNQLLSALFIGFSLILHDYLFPLDVLKILEHEKITGLAGVPTIWLDLLGIVEKYPKINFHKLRYITNSGGKLFKPTIQKLRTLLPSTDIYLMYGLTEAFRSTYLPPDQIDRRPESIGKAIPNVAIHLVNDRAKECAPGEVGELIHRGALIAKGYWGDPSKTEEIYRPNPLLPPHLRFTETVVYSGDLAKKDEEGYLYIIGRKDNMIKSAGYRISPNEITEVLLQMEGVQNAAVVGVEDEHLGQKIVAFLQINNSMQVTEQDCQQFVKRFLPLHMIPSTVICVRELPKNANGKVNLIELKNQAIVASELS